MRFVDGMIGNVEDFTKPFVLFNGYKRFTMLALGSISGV